MTTWNPSDASANITLSGGNLTATTTSATQGAVRATTSVGSGKIYYEATFGHAPITAGRNSTGFGWANSTAALGSFIGTDKNGVGAAPINSTGLAQGEIWFNNAMAGVTTGATANQFFAPVNGSTIRLATDLTGFKMWLAIDDSVWNLLAGDDPGSGVGGVSFATPNAGPYFPVFYSSGNGNIVTVNFGATPFKYPIPSGYSALDTSTFTYNASSKFNGYGVYNPGGLVASASKMLGYGMLGPSTIYAAASKLLGYAVLAQVPPGVIPGHPEWSPPPPRLPIRRAEAYVWGMDHIPPPAGDDDIFVQFIM